MTSIFTEAFITSNSDVVENCFFFNINNRIIFFNSSQKLYFRHCETFQCGDIDIYSIFNIVSTNNIIFDQSFFIETKGQKNYFIGSILSSKTVFISYINSYGMFENNKAGHIGIYSRGYPCKSNDVNFTKTAASFDNGIKNCAFQPDGEPIVSFLQVACCKGDCTWRSTDELLSDSVFVNNSVSMGVLSLFKNSRGYFRRVSVYGCGSKIAYSDDGSSHAVFEECFIGGIDSLIDDETKQFLNCVIIEKAPTTFAGKVKLRAHGTKPKLSFPIKYRLIPLIVKLYLNI